MSQNRHPAGTSLGGKFAPGAASEAEDALTDDDTTFGPYTDGYGLSEEQRERIEADLAYIDSEDDLEESITIAKESFSRTAGVPELADKDLQDIRAKNTRDDRYTFTAYYDEKMDDDIREAVEINGGEVENIEDTATITFSDLKPSEYGNQPVHVKEYHDAHARFQALHQLRTSPTTRSAWSVPAVDADEEHEFIVKYRFHTETDEERRQMIAQRWAKGWPGDPEAIPECPATGKEKL